MHLYFAAAEPQIWQVDPGFEPAAFGVVISMVPFGVWLKINAVPSMMPSAEQSSAGNATQSSLLD